MITTTTMTPTEFWDACEKHDWFYDYSDDARVWRAGDAERKRLQLIAKDSAELQAIYEGFVGYHFSGVAFGTEKRPKPIRPVTSTREAASLPGTSPAVLTNQTIREMIQAEEDEQD
jgi:hypothetical protein